MDLYNYLRQRGVEEKCIQKMEQEKIDPEIIQKMNDDDLKEYLPYRGDRMAAKAYIRGDLVKKTSILEKLRNRMKKTDSQVSNAYVKSKLQRFHAPQKHDKNVVLGICVADKASKFGFRQVRAPLGGGMRYSAVPKWNTKVELTKMAIPLFFPNQYGEASDFTFDVSLDVNGTQLMLEGETIELITKRLGLKNLRCYLLATPTNAALSEEETLPDVPHTKTVEHTQSESVNILHKEIVSETVDFAMGFSSENDTGSSFVTQNEKYVEHNDTNANVTFTDITSNTIESSLPTELVEEDFIARAVNESGIDDSDIDLFGTNGVQNSSLEDTITYYDPPVREIKVHRGLVCKDLIDYFSKEKYDGATYEVQMLKHDGTPEIAKDDGGVFRDALTEFFETFYVQYTEGSNYKVPVIRHDMTHDRWEAVASVIKIGYLQENIYPIRLAPAFMSQSIYGHSKSMSALLNSFLDYLPSVDKQLISKAMSDFESVNQEDVNDLLQQFDAKYIVNSENIVRIIHEIAHKELIQKPMFVADCFFKVLGNMRLAVEDITEIYSTLAPTTKKVLGCIQFPENPSSNENTIAMYLKKLIREIGDGELLGLFMRFCTGSDLMLQKKITLRFPKSGVSENVRSPFAHTCGCVLEIPIEYAQDLYVNFKADFVAILKTRYWQMDIV